MFLIGSRALGDNKPNSDWDLVLEDENISASKDVDLDPGDLLSLEICNKYWTGSVVSTPYGEAKVPHPIGLMLIKRSHLHRPINFAKHIQAYHKLKSAHYDTIDVLFNKAEYDDLLRQRTRLTKAKYGDRVPSLKKTKEDFFDDYVEKVYEHDDIHYATCYGERPIFEELKTDDKSVWCDVHLWSQLSYQDKVNCVREEAFVIAIERYLIPKDKYPPKFAFYNAVERICTTLCSGWFRDFAIDNWPVVVDHDYDFYGKFLQWKNSLPLEMSLSQN